MTLAIAGNRIRSRKRVTGPTNGPAATAAHTPRPAARAVLYGVSWDTYSALLEEIDGQNVRITYDRGAMELVVPNLEHETWKKVIGRMIELLSLERDIPIRSGGSTTFRQKKLKKGAQPDECYYVRNESKMRGKQDVDLAHDPPPDLVVEVDIESASVAKEPIYAAFGVPEVWRFDGRRLVSFQRTRAGRYVSRRTSRAFPFLRVADVDRFLRMLPGSDEMTVMRAWRDWLGDSGRDRK